MSVLRPVLFLDFDGVLVHQAHADDWIDDFGPAFDVEKSAYIAALQHQTNCRIVVISSWRNRAEQGLPAMQRMAKERGLDWTIDDTVVLRNDPQAATLGNRSSEIDHWLASQPGKDIGHIAILDDSMRVPYFSPHHYDVHVQPFWSGITQKDYEMTLHLLKNGPEPALRQRPAPTAPRP